MFVNGLDYYFGSNNDDNTSKESLCDILKTEMVFAEFDSANDIQNYFMDEFGEFYKFKDCEKIFNWYGENADKVREAIGLLEVN